VRSTGLALRAATISAAVVALTLTAISGSGAQVAGERIVYESLGDIWIMNADGTGQTNITNTPDWQEADPVLSPDGIRIAFSSHRPEPNNADENYEIFVMNDDGSGVIQLTVTDGTQPGTFVQSSEPTWAPSGTEIAFTGYRGFDPPQILKIAADGAGQEITLTDPQDFAYKGQPDWSPDGTKILFTWDLGQQDVFVMSAIDGSNQMNLTPETVEWDERSAVWSPDGARFAFVDNRFFNHLTFNTDIFVRDSDGSGEVQVTDHINIDDDPSWSPDGTEITFSSTRNGSYDIYVIAAPPPPPAGATPTTVGLLRAEAVNEAPVTQLTFAPGDQMDPDWGGEGGGGGGPFTLTVTKAGTGTGTVKSTDRTINCGSDCSETYPAGTQVTLQARVAAGSTFTGWSGACTGTATSCTVSMSQAVAVTATFTQGGGSGHLLTVTRQGTGQGSVRSTPAGIKCGADCTETYAPGTVVTLTAQVRPGSQFVGWSGACTGSNPTCQVTMNAPKTVTATFNTG
jgi:uncharacterized repeat protein (TIGR02543 family)